MNREIKFRSFVNNNKCIYFDFGNIRDLNFEEMRGYDIQEYTGLKDKNGKEIYEGDVIYRSSNNEYLKVAFSNLGCWKFENKDFQYYTINMNVKNGSLSTCEVIGNIYENPELL